MYYVLYVYFAHIYINWIILFFKVKLDINCQRKIYHARANNLRSEAVSAPSPQVQPVVRLKIYSDRHAHTLRAHV